MDFKNLAAALQGKRIFLTGSTGMFGKWILDTLREVNVDLVLLTRNPDRFIKEFPYEGTRPEISFVQGDIRDFSFPDGPFDYVIHAATPTNWDEVDGDDGKMYSVIVEGTEHTLSFAKHSGAGKFLYVSSGAVYGVQPTSIDRLCETYQCNPAYGGYGKGKLMAENLCLQSGLPVTVARCFTFIGPYFPLDEHFAVGNFIGSCLDNKTIEIKGDGTPLRSYMYSDDLARWLLTILLFGNAAEVYNVGSDEAISIEELARLVRDIAGSQNDIVIRQKADVMSRPARLIPSIDKASKELGLKVEIGIEDALIRTVKHYQGSLK